jgi:hypothetical protein
MKSNVKSTLIIFYDIKGVVHKEFVLASQIVNSTYYCDMATVCKCGKTSAGTLVTKELAVTSRQRIVSHYLFHQGIFDQKT